METLAPPLTSRPAQREESTAENASRAIAYRPEIDGLRAIAVVSVLLYHAFPQVLSGGFVGVDIFFVISGYLITSIILAESKINSFSFARFYERRARRLLPPLAPVLITTVILCFLLLNKNQIPNFADSLKANAAFLSNWYFLSKISYFDSPGAYTPLLHTWSLAVEEQFYFIFPLILLLTRGRANRFLQHVIVGLALLSFLYATYLICINLTDLAFYNSASRFWELLIGALLAVWKPRQLAAHKMLVMSLGGVTAIALALFYYSHETPFPGPFAVLPVIGTALLIASSGSENVIQKALSWRPLVGVGLISYSLYLWHWPLLVALRLVNPDPHPVWILGVLLFSGLLAWASFTLIERPIRAKRLLPNRTGIWVFSGVLLITTLAASFLLKVPFVQRAQQSIHADFEQTLYPKEKLLLLERLVEEEVRYMSTLNLNFMGDSGPYSASIHSGWTCSYDNLNTVDRILECLTKQASKDDNILIMGDSIGRDTLHALRLAFPSQHFIMLHASGCPPGKLRCFKNLREILHQLRSTVPVKAIFINFRYRPMDFATVEPGIAAAKEITSRVYLFGVSPVLRLTMSEYVKSLRPREMPPRKIRVSDAQLMSWDYGKLLNAAQAIAKRHGVMFVNVSSFFCPSRDHCRLWVDDRYGRPLFWDNQHLTVDGIHSFSRYLSQLPELQGF